MKNVLTYAPVLLLAALLVACGNQKSQDDRVVAAPPSRQVAVPTLSGDSAYAFVAQQVDFGPRVPNSEAHLACRDYLVDKLEQYGAQVQVQSFEAMAYTGEMLRLHNVMGQLFPEKKKRILLGAHWDTRPFADKAETDKYEPIDGANDGASGVGVLLEVARVLSQAEEQPSVGVDIIFFDGEDYGRHKDYAGPIPPEVEYEGWCLGSNHWANNKLPAGYSAFYGILLDMVGHTGVQFHKEGYSKRFAPSVQEKLWRQAQSAGYSAFFIDEMGGDILDDHVPVNQHAGIPMVNIISYDEEHLFFPQHHTHGDTMEQIDVASLKATGQAVLHFLYME